MFVVFSETPKILMMTVKYGSGFLTGRVTSEADYHVIGLRCRRIQPAMTVSGSDSTRMGK
jgi:hypothetical protein